MQRADKSVGFLRQVLERNVEERHIRVLELQLLLANRERPVADGEQLFLIEMQVPLVVHRPLEFARHAEGIHRTGIDTQPAKQAASHVHVILFRVALRRLARHFCADHANHARGASGLAEIATDTFFRPVFVPQQRQHPTIVVRQRPLFMRVLHGDRPIVQHVRHRHFHADEDVVKRDGLDPSFERHVCLVYLVVLVCLIDFSICASRQKRTHNPFQLLGKKYRVMDVMMMLASAIGNITFQPNRIN